MEVTQQWKHHEQLLSDKRQDYIEQQTQFVKSRLRGSDKIEGLIINDFSGSASDARQSRINFEPAFDFKSSLRQPLGKKPKTRNVLKLESKIDKDEDIRL